MPWDPTDVQLQSSSYHQTYTRNPRNPRNPGIRGFRRGTQYTVHTHTHPLRNAHATISRRAICRAPLVRSSCVVAPQRAPAPQRCRHANHPVPSAVPSEPPSASEAAGETPAPTLVTSRRHRRRRRAGGADVGDERGHADSTCQQGTAYVRGERGACREKPERMGGTGRYASGWDE